MQVYSVYLWLLYDRDLRHEKFKETPIIPVFESVESEFIELHK